MVGWVDVLSNGSGNRWMDGWVDGWVDRGLGGRIVEWTSGWMVG